MSVRFTPGAPYKPEGPLHQGLEGMQAQLPLESFALVDQRQSRYAKNVEVASSNLA